MKIQYFLFILFFTVSFSTVQPQPAGPESSNLTTQKLTVKEFSAIIYQKLNAEEYGFLETMLNRYISVIPSDMETERNCELFLYGFYRFDNDFKKSIEKWLRKMPDSYAANFALGLNLFNEAWHTRGNSFKKYTSEKQARKFTQLLRDSAKYFEKCISIKPDISYPYIWLIGIYGSMGKDYEFKTLEAYNNGLMNNSYSFRIRDMMINRLVPRWGGSYEKMQEIADNAKPLYEKYPYLKSLEGCIIKEKGYDLLYGYGEIKADKVKAKKYFTQALELYPGNLPAKFDLGLAGIELLQFDDGLRLMEEVVAVNPFDEWWNIMLINECLKQRLFDKATGYAEFFAGVNPDSHMAQMKLADVLEKRGKYREAATAFKKAIDIRPFSFFAYNGLKRMEKELGNNLKSVFEDKEFLEKYLAYIFNSDDYLENIKSEIKKKAVSEKPGIGKHELELIDKYMISGNRLSAELEKEIKNRNYTLDELQKITTYYAIVDRSENYLKEKYVASIREFFNTDEGRKLYADFKTMVGKLFFKLMKSSFGQEKRFIL